MDASEGQQLFPVVLKLFQHVTPDVAVLVQNSRRSKMHQEQEVNESW